MYFVRCPPLHPNSSHSASFYSLFRSHYLFIKAFSEYWTRLWVHSFVHLLYHSIYYTVEPPLSNVIRFTRLFEKRFLRTESPLSVTWDMRAWPYRYQYVRVAGPRTQELKICLTTEKFVPWTTWSRTELFEMGDVREPRFHCILKHLSWGPIRTL